MTTLWVGGLWTIGYLAAPVLFSAQPDKQLAGMLAGQMFTWIAYLGMLCGGYLLVYRLNAFDRAAAQMKIFWLIAIMLIITLAIQYGIQPVMAELKIQALPLDVMHSTLADQFKMLHGVSSILYLIESLLGAWLLIKSKGE